MRLVHMADLHLGLSRYARQTATGRNQRTVDVEEAFTRAVDKTIALAPDLVIVAGDVFHVHKPTNATIVHADREFFRLTHALPNAIVVVLAGNHDQAATKEAVCAIRLFEKFGVHVVDERPTRLRFPERGLSILAVPEVDELTEPLAIDPDARVNVLAVHGEIRGLIRGSRAALMYDADDIAAGAWDYAAFGHYHDYTQIAPRAFYSGALDFATSDVWHEHPRKGLIEYDLDAHAHVFHELPVSRPHIDLPAIQGMLKSPDELNALIRAAVATIEGGVDGKVVRLVVRDVTTETERALDHKMLRDWKACAVHFQLDCRRPAKLEYNRVVRSGQKVDVRALLEKRLRERPLADDIDRDQFVAAGLKYFDDVSPMVSANDPLLKEVAV